jgi:hypothetical protein
MLFPRARYSLKSEGADERHRLMRIVQRLVVRARDTARSLENDPTGAPSEAAAAVARPVAAAPRPAAAAPYWSSKKKKGAPAEADAELPSASEAEVVDEAQELKGRVEASLRWLCQELLRQLYPGAPFGREVGTHPQA